MRLLLVLGLISLSLAYVDDSEQEELSESQSGNSNDLDDPDNPLYEPTGVCHKPGCVPFANFTFAKIWEKYPPAKAAELVNEKIRKNPLISKSIEARPPITRGGFESVAIFAKEDIPQATMLGTFRAIDALNTNSLSFELFSEDFPLRRQQKRFSKLNFTEHGDKFNFVLNLLVHLYYFDYSLLQEDLLLLPRYLRTPYFLLNNYEVDNFLKGDEAQVIKEKISGVPI